jgi:PAS domain S-box-containing protein
MLKEDGTRFWAHLTATAAQDGEGAPVCRAVISDITGRKQAEVFLRESETKHKTMIANISDVIAIMAGDGTLRYKSPNIEKWFGWQPEDLVGTDGWDTVHPDDLERIQKEFLMLLEQDRAKRTVEYRYKCKDGSYRLIELTAINLTHDPLINGVLMNYRDITERKQAEEAITSATLKTIGILESITDAFFALDENLVTTYFNTAAERLLNRNRMDVIGRNLFEAFPEAKGSVFEEMYTRAIREKEMLTFETYFGEKPYENWYEVRIYPQRDGISVFFQVVTERKQAEDELKHSEERFNLAISGTGAGLWDWDIVKDIVFYSTGWKSMLGYENHEIENTFTGWKDLWHPDDADRIEQAVNDYLEGRTARYEIEHRLRHKDGSWHWILTRGDLQRDAAGKPFRWIGTNIDVTERKQAEEALVENEGLLREIAANYPNSFLSIIEKDLTVGFTAGQEFKKLGLDPASFIGLTLEQVFGEHTPLVREHYMKAFSGAETEFELFINKQFQWYRVVPLKGSSGQIDRILAVVENITARKQAESDLKAAYNKLEALWSITRLEGANLKTISDHILVTIARMTGSEYGFYGFVNEKESVMTIHSWSGEAMNDCSLVDKPQHFPINEAGIWAEAIRHRKPFILNNYNIEQPAKKGLPVGHVPLKNLLVVPHLSHGRIISVAAVANRLNDYTQDDVSQIATFLASIEAIIESKRSEEALRESEDRFLRLTAISNDLIYRYEIAPRRGFSYVSPSATAITGFTPEEHYADPDLGFKLVHPDDRTILEAVSHGEHPVGQPLVLRWIRKDGTIIWTEQRNVSILDPNGSLEALEGIARDISERKQTEAKIHEQLEELKRWHNITLGREDRIMELKREVNKLLAEAGKPPHYASVTESAHE